MSNKNIKQDIYVLTKSILSDIDDLETKNLGKLVGMYQRARQGFADFRDPEKRAERMDARDAAREEAAALKKGRAQTRFNRLTQGVDKTDAISPAQKKAYEKQLAERQKMKDLLNDPLVSDAEKAIYQKRLAKEVQAPTARQRTDAELAAYGLQNKANKWLKEDNPLAKWNKARTERAAQAKSDRKARRAARDAANLDKTKRATEPGYDMTMEWQARENEPGYAMTRDWQADQSKRENEPGYAMTQDWQRSQSQTQTPDAPADPNKPDTKSILNLINKSIRNIQNG